MFNKIKSILLGLTLSVIALNSYGAAYSTGIGGTGISQATVPKGTLFVGAGTANALTSLAAGANYSTITYDSSQTSGLAPTYIFKDSSGVASINYTLRELISAAVPYMDWSNELIVKIGTGAGTISQADHTVAIGENAAHQFQDFDGIAIGFGAGNDTQGMDAIAIGTDSALANQGAEAISIGHGAGGSAQPVDDIAIGHAALNGGFANTIAIGHTATNTAANQAILPVGVNWSLSQINDLSNFKSIDIDNHQLTATNGITTKVAYGAIGSTDFYTNNGLQFTITDDGSATTNKITVSGASTGNSPSITVSGTDTNIGLKLVTKGTGSIFSANQIHANGGFTANDSSSLSSINSITRRLFASDGSSVVFDYSAGLINDTAGLLFFDLNNRQIVDEAGALAATFTAAFRQLYDNPGNISLDFQNRSLYASNATINLTWQTPGLLDGSPARFKSRGLEVSEAANGKQGAATLVGGTVTVSNTSIGANSRIILTAQDNNCVGNLRISSRSVATNFVITSSVVTDTCVAAYEIFEAA